MQIVSALLIVLVEKLGAFIRLRELMLGTTPAQYGVMDMNYEKQRVDTLYLP
jgi:hypothetical protein